MILDLEEAKSFGTHKGFVPVPRHRPERMLLVHRRHEAGEARFAKVRANYERELSRMLNRYWRESDTDDAALRRRAWTRLKNAGLGEIRHYYRQAYLAGASASSGLNHRVLPMAARDWVLEAAKSEKEYWDRFMAQARSGELRQDPATRISWYGDSLSAVYDAGRVAAAPGLVIAWDVDVQAENCPDCLLLERSGPYVRESLPTTPRAGDTRCIFKCRCKLVFRAPTSARELMLLQTRGSSVKAMLLRTMEMGR